MDLLKLYWDSTVGYVNWLLDIILFKGNNAVWGNYFWYLTIVSLFFWGIELLKPWRGKQKAFRKDFWLDAFYMYFNFFIIYIILFAGLEKVAAKMFDDLFGVKDLIAIEIQSLPEIFQLIIAFVLIDFVHWNVHRLLHKVPFLWNFHKLHHSVKEMGFAAHLRFHWVESILYKSITFIPFSMIGFGIDDFFLIHVFTIAWGHYNHSNFTFPLGPLKYIFNNPAMHLWHHAKALPKGSYGVNFGLTLSIWDYIFKTDYIPEESPDLELGFIGDEDYPDDFIHQQTRPFLGK